VCPFVASVLLLCSPAFARAPSTAASYDGARIIAEAPVAGGSPGVRGVQLTISTPAFTTPTQVQLFLPAGYDAEPKRRWPVTYYLHGAQGDDTRFNAWYGGLIGGYPSIVVAPSGGAFGWYSNWYNRGAFGPPEYETYDIDQLIPLIDANFRTIPRRQGRALIGESMGGYGVMSYAALHPDLFGGVVSMSGLVDSNYGPGTALITASPTLQSGDPPDAIYGPRATELVRWYGHNPTNLASNLRNVAMRITTATGSPAPAEGPVPVPGCPEEMVIYQTNLDLEQELVALGIPHQWQVYGKGCHDIWNFQREFVDGLPFLEQLFAKPQPDPQTFNYATIEPDFTIWGWQVKADPQRALEFMQIQNAGRSGLTLIGSGTTGVETPPFFRGRRAVAVSTGDSTEIVAPDRSGRLSFTVDLGSPHRYQQYTPAAEAVGENTSAYFTTRTVRFAPSP
jgi:S-formylglutathione hydrolase FrmB